MLETPEEATPAWISSVLWAAGSITRGEVVAVERASTTAFNSTTTHLHLSYSEDADAGAPARLILKLALAEDWARRAGAAEVAFYRAAADRGLPMLAACVAAEHDPVSGRALLLLRDLDLTHEPAVTRRQLVEGHGVPTGHALDAVIEALADFHAAWWEAPPPPGVLLAPWLEPGPAFARFAARSRAELDLFIRAAGHRVTDRALEITERAVIGLHHGWAHRLRSRAETGHQLTLVHGDCYLSNWLVPRDGVEGSAVIVDFQQAHIDTPGEDLAFLLGTFWTPAQRARHEARCLRRYLARLDRRGYDWPQLLADYRWGLERMVVRTIWDHQRGSPEWYWRPKLERVTAALADHLLR